MSTDPTATPPSDNQRRREIVEQHREEFDREFETTDDKEALRARIEDSLQKQLKDECTTNCLTNYMACQAAGGANCKAIYNTCMINCTTKDPPPPPEGD